jgi:hypothetical protein
MTEQTPEPQAGPEQNEQQPPWGDDFDAEKAWKLVQNLRSDKEKLASRPTLDDDAARKLAEYDRLEQASKTDLERKTEELNRWQTEALRWQKDAVSARVEALAATDFADPSDAIHSLDPAKYLGAGGEIDTNAIKTDLAALLDAKPHYRRVTEPAGPRTPAPNPAQGRAGGPASSPAEQFAALITQQLAGA